MQSQGADMTRLPDARVRAPVLTSCPKSVGVLMPDGHGRCLFTALVGQASRSNESWWIDPIRLHLCGQALARYIMSVAMRLACPR